MDTSLCKTIVISAVTVTGGNLLDALNECLEYLSPMAVRQEMRVIAIVQDNAGCTWPGIEYITYPEVAGGKPKLHKCLNRRLFWDSRLIAEQDDRPVSIWISFDDTTPVVEASCRVLYCSTALPLLKTNLRDWLTDYTIPLKKRSVRKALKSNVSQNDWIISRETWLRPELSRMLRFDPSRIIVFPQRVRQEQVTAIPARKKGYTFFYPASPECYKNAELICEAARLLELEIGRSRFSVELTMLGNENKYAFWVKSNWSQTDSIHFNGVLSREKAQGWYDAADCLIFSSRNETWARPVARFMDTGKPMLLVDLPYARESAGGAPAAQFFPLGDAGRLKEMMKALVFEDTSGMKLAPFMPVDEPAVYDWKGLFNFLNK